MHRKLISQYQALLTVEESTTAFDDAMALARRIASGGRSGHRNGWTRIAQPSDVRASSRRQNSDSPSARRLGEAIDILSTLPLIAQKADIPDDQYSLLMDTLLVVFHQAYFVLLSKAGGRRQSLLKAFSTFAETLPNCADRFQVKGLVEIELGNADMATESFRAALAATPSDQHDFLTRVQMLWSFLMERDEVSRAFTCLQDVAPRVTRIDFDELQGLYAATFEEAQRR
jgi:tetratricopeptide (TPR) repeat protein